MRSSSLTVTSVQQILSEVLSEQPLAHKQEVDSSVAAVITVEADETYLPETLRAVLSQRVLPTTVIIVDCSRDEGQSYHLRTDFGVDANQPDAASEISIEVVKVQSASSFADAVQKALRSVQLPASVHALWLLHDDSKPLDDHCLEALAETWHGTPTVSLLGCKQFDWNGKGLHNVGYYSDKSHVNSLVVDGEPDQEQYDGRQDVFAVSLSGALLPIQTLGQLTDLGTWTNTFGQSRDFSRRVCLSGGRVVVVPTARIAHRRARYEGVRTLSGQKATDQRDSSMQVIDARESYFYAGHTRAVWPILWIFRLFAAMWFTVVRLMTKQPYAAMCELCSPWRVLAHAGRLLYTRQKVRQVNKTTKSRLEPLQVSEQQVKQWRLRNQAYQDQINHPMLNNLARAHLRHQRFVRAYWICGAMLVSCVAVAVCSWSLFKGLLAGGSLRSDYLLASAANLSQAVQSATVPWTWGVGVGTPAAPNPFFLFLLPFVALTNGQVSAAIAVLFFASVPLSVLSFWALAGIFTRSNPIRVISALLWSVLAFVFPIFSDGDLPNLIVMIFLPAAFAYVFRAVGSYCIDSPAQPHPSIRSAACSAVCFAAVVLAEPQLLLGLIIIFVLFTFFVGQHRGMLALIPLPAAFAMAPTLVNTVVHWSEGLWRQLFADITLPSSERFGAPRFESISNIVASLVGFDYSQPMRVWVSNNTWQSLCIVLFLAVVLVIALVSLCVPSVARVSRLMWFLSIIGAMVAMVSTAVEIGQDWNHPVAGSPIPGLLLMMLGILSCVSMMAGSALRPFSSLNTQQASREHINQGIISASAAPHISASTNRISNKASTVLDEGNSLSSAGRRWKLSNSIRMVFAMLLLAVFAVAAVAGMSRQTESSLRADEAGLPMVAVDYLSRSEKHRVLMVTADSDRQISYAVMHTARGDVVDASASAQAIKLGEQQGEAEKEMSEAVSALIASPNADSIETLGRLGIGGIFVTNGSSSAERGTKSPEDMLTANIAASDGVQQVVSSTSGSYYRFTVVDAGEHGVDLAGEHDAARLWWRFIWIWTLVFILFAYVLVALPRWRLVEGVVL